MHQDINYGNLAEPEKSEKAIEDIKNWLGVKKFNWFEKTVRGDHFVTFAEFELACGMGGIQGFPVKAWAKKLGVVDGFNDTSV